MGAHTALFEEWYDQYADDIFRHLYFRLGNRERALDLTQDVFARLWIYLEKGKAIEHPKAFLYTSAHHAFVNDIRTPNRNVSLDTLAEKGFEIQYEGTDIQQKAEQQEVVDTIATLEPQARALLTMRYVDGLTVKEIANVLTEKENTVSVRIKRALEKLKETYES